MEFKNKRVKDLVAPLVDRQRALEDEYVSNYNALKVKQAEGFSDDSEDVQAFARNLQTIEAAHIAVTAQIEEAQAMAQGPDKESHADLPIPVEVLSVPDVNSEVAPE